MHCTLISSYLCADHIAAALLKSTANQLSCHAPATLIICQLHVAQWRQCVDPLPLPSPPLPLFLSPFSQSVCTDQCNRKIGNRDAASEQQAASGVCNVQRATNNEQFLMCTFCSVAIANVTVCCHSERVEERMPRGKWGSWQRVAGGCRGHATRLRLPKCQMAGHIS